MGSLGSSGITRLPRYSGPLRHPLVFDRFPGGTGYTASLAPPISRWDEEGFSSCLIASWSPCCRSHPAGVARRDSQPATGHAAFTLRMRARPPGRLTFGATTAFTFVTAR